MKFGGMILILLASMAARAASPVVSIYDNASFRTGLTLPFMVETLKTNTSARISGLSVQAANEASVAAASQCKIAADKFLRTHFLVKCVNSGEFNLRIDIADGSDLRTINYGPIKIEPLKPGYVEPIDPGPITVDPDIAKGRAVLFTKTQSVSPYFTCIGCHSTPDTYNLRTRASTTTLMNLKSKTAMSDVPNLTSAEAAQVLKYLKTVKDGAVWP